MWKGCVRSVREMARGGKGGKSVVGADRFGGRDPSVESILIAAEEV